MPLRTRLAEERLNALLRSFPGVLVLGPRQCGKSTLVRSAFPKWTHLDLERPLDLRVLEADLEGFLDAHPRHVVFDEAQRYPPLFTALRHAIDRNRSKGRFLLLGSSSPELVRGISETLAGRLAILELTPFLSREFDAGRPRDHRWFFGGYPPVHALRSFRDRSVWLDAYVMTFLERDLPALGLRLPVARLRKLWTMLTHVHGNLLNVSDLARSLAVSSPTVAHYLDVLEGAFLIRRLQPLHANLQKRLTKSPKVYVRDTGLLHFLAGLREPRELQTWPRRGQSFEGLVLEELIALANERLVRPEICFYRTTTGTEIDLLIGDGSRFTAFEIKLGAAPDPRDLKGLQVGMGDLGIERAFVVCTARERRRLTKQIEIVPWQAVAAGDVDFGWRKPRRRSR